MKTTSEYIAAIREGLNQGGTHWTTGHMVAQLSPETGHVMRADFSADADEFDPASCRFCLIGRARLEVLGNPMHENYVNRYMNELEGYYDRVAYGAVLKALHESLLPGRSLPATIGRVEDDLIGFNDTTTLDIAEEELRDEGAVDEDDYVPAGPLNKRAWEILDAALLKAQRRAEESEES